MGRDVHWYVIPRTIDHDKAKPLCYNFECQPEEHECTEYVDATTDKWCPKCYMFVFGFYDAPGLVDTHHIAHSYSNPIWHSKWNIHSLMMGSGMTPYMKLFDPENLYREITQYDIFIAKRYLESLGEPIRSIDKEAYEETQEVMEFLEKWTTESDTYRVIIADET